MDPGPNADPYVESPLVVVVNAVAPEAEYMALEHEAFIGSWRDESPGFVGAASKKLREELKKADGGSARWHESLGIGGCRRFGQGDSPAPADSEDSREERPRTDSGIDMRTPARVQYGAERMREADVLRANTMILQELELLRPTSSEGSE